MQWSFFKNSISFTISRWKTFITATSTVTKYTFIWHDQTSCRSFWQRNVFLVNRAQMSRKDLKNLFILKHLYKRVVNLSELNVSWNTAVFYIVLIQFECLYKAWLGHISFFFLRFCWHWSLEMSKRLLLQELSFLHMNQSEIQSRFHGGK